MKERKGFLESLKASNIVKCLVNSGGSARYRDLLNGRGDMSVASFNVELRRLVEAGHVERTVDISTKPPAVIYSLRQDLAWILNNLAIPPVSGVNAERLNATTVSEDEKVKILRETFDNYTKGFSAALEKLFKDSLANADEKIWDFGCHLVMGNVSDGTWHFFMQHRAPAVKALEGQMDPSAYRWPVKKRDSG